MRRKRWRDDEIEALFKGYNFGSGADHRKILKFGVLKKVCGFSPGYSLNCIMIQAKFFTPKRGTLTRKGKEFLWMEFEKEYYK